MGGAELLKSYLPLRIHLQKGGVKYGDEQQEDGHSTFMFIKQQGGGKRAKGGNDQQSNSAERGTIFVCNAISLSMYLDQNNAVVQKCTVPDFHSFDRFALEHIFNKFGVEVQNVFCANAPGQDKQNDTIGSSIADNSYKFIDKSSRLPFAHVIFSSQKEVKKVLTRASKEEHIKLSRIEINELFDQWVENIKNLNNEDDETNADDREEKQLSGISAVIARYKARIPDRSKLAEQCDLIMSRFDESEEAERQAMLKSQEPDEDGFITVTKESNIVGKKRQLNDDWDSDDDGAEGVPSRKKGGKRFRKKKKGRGSSELNDFYRFQTRESKRKEVTDLRKRFEEDLQAVKRMKEQKQFKPLG